MEHKEREMEYGDDCYRRFLSGDENAFAEMVETYREGLIFFLCRYVNSVETAEDLAEDVFVEVLLHPKRYRLQCTLKTWLFAIGPQGGGFSSQEQPTAAVRYGGGSGAGGPAKSGGGRAPQRRKQDAEPRAGRDQPGLPERHPPRIF